MARSRTHQAERTLGMATRFLDEVRTDIQRAAQEGGDIPPRIRSVHEKPGHATPEFRTVGIPVPDGMAGASPDVLSDAIATYARQRRPDCMLLAMEAEMEVGGSARLLLIAEARDRTGTRMYWMQPYRPGGAAVDWDEPLDGGWRDPGEQEMILDAAFSGAAAEPPPARRPRRRRAAAAPAPDREVPVPGLAGVAD